MVKNSFISLITQEEKEENKGSIEFQIFSFTNKITYFTFGIAQKRLFITKGSKKILGKRRHMLAYLSKKNGVRYKKLIDQLDIWEPQIANFIV